MRWIFKKCYITELNFVSSESKTNSISWSCELDRFLWITRHKSVVLEHLNHHGRVILLVLWQYLVSPVLIVLPIVSWLFCSSLWIFMVCQYFSSSLEYLYVCRVLSDDTRYFVGVNYSVHIAENVLICVLLCMALCQKSCFVFVLSFAYTA